MAPPPAGDSVLADCKYKLNQFKVKELKDVLHQLGISKKGRRQDLVHRIIALLSNDQDQVSGMNDLPNRKKVGKETVVKIVEDIFTKMQDSANTGGSKSENESEHSVKPEKKSDDSTQLDVKVCCPCGNSMVNDSIIKCDDPQCNIWQHAGCVIIPERHAGNVIPKLPSQFYCEMCRISRADPFWVTVKHPLLPVSIGPSYIAADGSTVAQYFDKTFLLSRVDWEMVQKDEYALQVWCILLNDKVPFRMHWPLHSFMQVNGLYVRVFNRYSSERLGANGRDDGPALTTYSREGLNKIVITKSDSRTFCLGVRIAKRRSLEEVLNLVPKEQYGEKNADALARVRRCVGGGTEVDNADSDSDIKAVADSASVNLRCPITGSRIRIAGRFKPCAHMGCFDLEAFVALNERSRKWQCPICLNNYSLESLIIDPYFNRITSLIQSRGDHASEIDVKPTGCWRVKGRSEAKDLTQWHLPDGTLCMAEDAKAKLNKNKINEEQLSEDLGCRLKLGSRRSNNCQRQVGKRGDPMAKLMPSSRVYDWVRSFGNAKESYSRFSPRQQDIIVLSDSEDDDDASVSSPPLASVRPRPIVVITIDSDSD